MQIIISIITLSIMITPLVVLHELGHYLTAKYFKVRVLEFGIGFPPKIFSFWGQRESFGIEKDLIFDLSELNINQEIYIQINSSNNIYKIKKEKPEENFNDFIKVKISEISDKKLTVYTMSWSINLIPFGGFVKLFGEEKNKSKDSLSQASYLGRFVILFSGSFINFLLPFIIMFLVNIFILEKNVADIIIQDVMPDSPAELAGLKPGDKILSINEKTIYTISDLQSEVSQNLGKESDWEIVRGIPNVFQKPGEDIKYFYNDESTNDFIIKARWDPPSYKVGLDISLAKARSINPYSGSITYFNVENTPSNKTMSLIESNKYSDYKIGDQVPIVLNENYEGIPLSEARKINPDAGITDEIQEGSIGILISTQNPRVYKENVSENFKTAFNQSISIYKLSYFSIIGIINRSTNPIFEGPKAIGPIGLGQISGNIVYSSESTINKIFVLITIASSISLSLSIINLLPFPALDGGRLAFLFIEIFRRGKKVPERIESYIHGLGFIILILLILFISFKDISRL
ncbi:MAG: site-2 protease family protein [Chloroflexota bacterium]|nr:site-2 protease family protein [Chloroflexota bacterium]